MKVPFRRQEDDGVNPAKRGSKDSDSLSDVDDSTSATLFSDKEKAEVERVQKISAGDTRRVRLWRTVVVLALIAVGTLVSVFTYFLIRGDETKLFERAVS